MTVQEVLHEIGKRMVSIREDRDGWPAGIVIAVQLEDWKMRAYTGVDAIEVYAKERVCLLDGQVRQVGVSEFCSIFPHNNQVHSFPREDLIVEVE